MVEEKDECCSSSAATLHIGMCVLLFSSWWHQHQSHNGPHFTPNRRGNSHNASPFLTTSILTCRLKYDNGPKILNQIFIRPQLSQITLHNSTEGSYGIKESKENAVFFEQWPFPIPIIASHYMRVSKHCRVNEVHQMVQSHSLYLRAHVQNFFVIIYLSLDTNTNIIFHPIKV